jgi:hypothetical protein
MATIATTQTAKAKKKSKRVGPAAPANTAAVSSGVETINVEEEENEAKSPSAATVSPPEMPRKAMATEGQSLHTPCKGATLEECSRSGAVVLGDAGSQKKVKKAPPKP